MPITEDVTLKPHQERVQTQAETNIKNEQPTKMLVVHGMGTGKTLTSLAAAEKLQAPYTVVVPAALRRNYQESTDRFVVNGQPSNIVSYNRLAKDPESLTADTVVFDEAQRLTSPGSLQSQAAKLLAQKAKNVLLLSGTPMRNDPSELAPLVSILTGKHINPEEFRDKFIKVDKSYPGGTWGMLTGAAPEYKEQLDNVEEFRNLLAGKVDYYKPSTHPVPVKTETHEADMHPDQIKIYQAMFNKMPFLTRWKLKHNYPLKPQEYLKLQSFMTGPRQAAISLLPYMSQKHPLKAFSNSGKLQSAFGKLKEFLGEDENKKAIIYSNFINAGLVPYSAGLQAHGVPHAMFHGGLSDKERQQLVDDFNSGKIRVALIGPSGSEGISLKGARLTQILDPHWHESRTAQAAARGVRMDSHTHLPEDQQNMTVQHFVSRIPKSGLAGFWSMLTRGSAKDLTVDHYLRNMSDNKQKLITEVEKELENISKLRR